MKVGVIVFAVEAPVCNLAWQDKCVWTAKSNELIERSNGCRWSSVEVLSVV